MTFGSSLFFFRAIPETNKSMKHWMTIIAVLGVTTGFVAWNRRTAFDHCALRADIVNRRGDLVRAAFDADMVLTDFPVAAMVGMKYQDHADVKKMFDRARTGGGFVPFRVVGDDGRLVKYLLYVESPAGDGGVVARGKVVA